MLKDCLEVFKEVLDREGEDILIDQHIPADGIYILVDINNDEKINIVNIKYNRKETKLEFNGDKLQLKFAAFQELQPYIIFMPSEKHHVIDHPSLYSTIQIQELKYPLESSFIMISSINTSQL